MTSAARPRWGHLAVALLAASLASAAESARPDLRPVSWSQQKVIEARNAGKTVFVAFRADWCVICRLNEVTVFRSDKVRAALADPDVTYMVADYTDKKDPAIKSELEYYQAGALPMYLVFRPDRRRPGVLGQMPGAKEVTQSLRE